MGEDCTPSGGRAEYGVRSEDLTPFVEPTYRRRQGGVRSSDLTLFVEPTHRLAAREGSGLRS
jgi:hypothetical protein